MTSVFYARPPQEYVTLRHIRDVVERPIIGEYVYQPGWDIR